MGPVLWMLWDQFCGCCETSSVDVVRPVLWLLWDQFCGCCGTSSVDVVGPVLWMLWDQFCGCCGIGIMGMLQGQFCGLVSCLQGTVQDKGVGHVACSIWNPSTVFGPSEVVHGDIMREGAFSG